MQVLGLGVFVDGYDTPDIYGIHANEIDLLRCVRKAYSDLVFNAKGDSTFSQIDVLVLPWLEYVNGDVRVVKPGAGQNTFDTVKLSRLAHIGGELRLDFNPAFEGLRLASLTTIASVDIDLRTMDLDLTGLDALVSIAGRLRLHNPNAGDPPVFRGLRGLTEVGSLSLSVSGRGAFDDTSGVGLSSLRVIRGDVPIHVVAPSNALANYRAIYAIYATRAIETICGNLVLSTPVQIEDYRRLRTVYGDLRIDTASSVQGSTLPWLSRVTGDLELEGNPLLPYARLPRLTTVGDEIVVDAF